VPRDDQLEPFDDAAAVLALLTDEPRIQWSEAELHLQMGWPPERISDALTELRRDGLAHQQGGFAWPTRAAVRCRELLA
jgi:DNA-binding IclR family transcriptional regulator